MKTIARTVRSPRRRRTRRMRAAGLPAGGRRPRRPSRTHCRPPWSPAPPCGHHRTTLPGLERLTLPAGDFSRRQTPCFPPRDPLLPRPPPPPAPPLPPCPAPSPLPAPTPPRSRTPSALLSTRTGPTCTPRARWCTAAPSSRPCWVPPGPSLARASRSPFSSRSRRTAPGSYRRGARRPTTRGTAGCSASARGTRSGQGTLTGHPGPAPCRTSRPSSPSSSCFRT
ncbi:hypothetical protein DFJ74DRAFT_657216 [Hyaloraphidium curvatum]|nr:hypothetical protein DFJ74DRAFT_657216 [Hyaloraphidium curvatum]